MFLSFLLRHRHLTDNKSEPAHSRFPLNYFMVTLLIVVLISLLGTVFIHREWVQIRESEKAATRNAAALIDQTIAGLFTKIDLSLQTSGHSYMDMVSRNKVDAPALEELLSEHRRFQSEISELRITNAEGVDIYGLDTRTVKQKNLVDHTFFKEMRSAATKGLVVSAPLHDEVSQKWVLVLSRRLENEQGKFFGIIYSFLPIDSFQPYLSKIKTGPNSTTSIRFENQALIYKLPRAAETIGSTKVSEELQVVLGNRLTEDIFTDRNALDGVARTNAFRKMGNYPMYVVVGAAHLDGQKELIFHVGLAIVLLGGALLTVVCSAYLAGRTTIKLDTELSIRKKLEATLQQAQHALAKAQEITKMGNWMRNTKTGAPFWSNEIYSIFRFNPADGTPSFQGMEKYFDPESWSRLKQAVHECKTSGKPYDLDFRIIRADGETGWINAKGAAKRSDDGEILEVHGTAQDISERKLLEIGLSNANKELNDLYNNVPCGYYSLDEKGHYARINDTMLEWIGYSRDMAIGRLGPKDSFSENSKILFDNNFPIFLKTGKIQDLEFELQDRRGKTRHVTVSATAVFDEDGQYLMSRSVMLDVTALRLAKERLRIIKEQQDLILANQMVGVVKLKDRIATWFNPALACIFGYSPSELEGQGSRMLYADEGSYEAIGKQAYPKLAAGDTYRTQVQMRRKDGSLIWIDMYGVLLDKATDESLWILADINSIYTRKENFEFESTHDSLTGLANRTLLNELLPKVLANASRKNLQLAICYLDLNAFKPINDLHGHVAGDAVLKAVGKRMLECVREVDVVARIGGDEFIILLTGLESSEACQAICNRLRASITQPVQFGKDALSVGVSIGVALFPHDGEDIELLMSLADQRMYQDKKAANAPDTKGT